MHNKRKGLTLERRYHTEFLRIDERVQKQFKYIKSMFKPCDESFMLMSHIDIIWRRSKYIRDLH